MQQLFKNMLGIVRSLLKERSFLFALWSVVFLLVLVWTTGEELLGLSSPGKVMFALLVCLIVFGVTRSSLILDRKYREMLLRLAAERKWNLDREKSFSFSTGTIDFRPSQMVAHGMLGDERVIVGVGVLSQSTGLVSQNEMTSSGIVITTHFASSVEGWARLIPSSSPFRGIVKETDLESNQFNKKVQIHAQPPKLAFALFHPDFMDWYLSLAPRPWVVVKGNALSIVCEGRPTQERLEAFLQQTTTIHHYLRESGAFGVQKTGSG